jgi:hypothetical protein
MVKDYKRIHHLDFAEPDLDDSDGGYSDYQISDSELGQPEPSSNDINLNEPQKSETLLFKTIKTNFENYFIIPVPKLINSRYRCSTCQKIYLGHKRLTQHYLQYPDHGSIDAVPQQLPPGKIFL